MLLEEGVCYDQCISQTDSNLMQPFKNVSGSKSLVGIDLVVKFSTLDLTLRPLRDFGNQ